MDSSSCFRYGSFIATLHLSRLIIRLTNSLSIFRTVDVQPDFASSVSFIRWSPGRRQADDVECDSPLRNRQYTSDHREVARAESPLRILLADEHTIRVWDIHDSEWSATIDNAGGSIGKPANIEFGQDDNEVLTFYDFGINVKIWSLSNSRRVEIRDPKFTTKGHGYRPKTGHFALLARPAAHDIITLHAPRSYKLIESFMVATVDAQGLKWSPDGRWLAIWDSASSGYKVLIYTPDGHLYRTYTGDKENGVNGLGVKSIEWSPHGKYLAIGGYDNRITLLSTTTFSPVIFLDHTSTIKIPSVSVWQEQVSASKQRSYVVATQPMCPPTITSLPTDINQKTGISILAFNTNGTLVATRNDSMPTTVWIWSLKLLAPYAILVQHSAVRSIQWHASCSDLLMLHCVNEDPLVYLWSSNWDQPRIVAIPLEKLAGRQDVRWIYTTSDQRPTMMFGDAQNYVVGSVRGEGAQTESSRKEYITAGNPEPLFDEGNSMDFSPVKFLQEDSLDGFDVDSVDDISGVVDDTFHYRRYVAISG
ncbi:MAG: hypothetical protein M1830_010398 [Pleopsidium flavum]|nr:MAG: hypothetical protein M1830_010398 [Pleopsidium flavum]